MIMTMIHYHSLMNRSAPPGLLDQRLRSEPREPEGRSEKPRSSMVSSLVGWLVGCGIRNRRFCGGDLAILCGIHKDQQQSKRANNHRLFGAGWSLAMNRHGWPARTVGNERMSWRRFLAWWVAGLVSGGTFCANHFVH